MRLQETSGNRSHSRRIPIRRGSLQGDIPSPTFFLAALDKLLKDHGEMEAGIVVTHELLISQLAFADDAALPTEDTKIARHIVTLLRHRFN